ncbi:MAG: hypothetical protein IKE75_00415 [Bacilli bacterium]|nr:hypothetical protein [Bacilli bacterium]
MNNKGFTVVELLTSFTLTMIIMIFLFEIVLQVKDIYINSTLKTKVLTQNAIVASTIHDKLKGANIAYCEDNVSCIVEFPSGRDISIRIDDKNIIIDNQIIEYPKNINSIDSNLEAYNDGINSYLKVKYTIKSNFLNEEIPFNYVESF